MPLSGVVISGTTRETTEVTEAFLKGLLADEEARAAH